MSITEFLAKVGFKPYGSVVNSWDSFSPSGAVLMQLWTEPGQRVRDHAVPGAYLRVCCWNSKHFEQAGRNHPVGYNGRLKAILAAEVGARAYAALSDAPEAKRRAGVWAQNADLSKVYPVLHIERPAGSRDVFAVLGPPVPVEALVE